MSSRLHRAWIARILFRAEERVHLVDTNVLSEPMRPRADRKVLSWATQQPGFFISVITLEEIWYGLEVKQSARLDDRFASFIDEWCEVLPITPAIARRCAHFRATASAAGKARTQADMLIAATAREHEAILATRNVRDFGGCGIRVVNPFTA